LERSVFVGQSTEQPTVPIHLAFNTTLAKDQSFFTCHFLMQLVAFNIRFLKTSLHSSEWNKLRFTT